MPLGDRTGPAGKGPMTGRKLGYGAGYSVPGFMNTGSKKMNKERKWIQAMHMEKGALHRTLNVPEGKKIPAKELSVKKGDSALMKKRKTLAHTLKGFKK